jgi:hypothetical protein
MNMRGSKPHTKVLQRWALSLFDVNSFSAQYVVGLRFVGRREERVIFEGGEE